MWLSSNAQDWEPIRLTPLYDFRTAAGPTATMRTDGTNVYVAIDSNSGDVTLLVGHLAP